MSYLQNYKEFEAEILCLQLEKYMLSFDIRKYTTSGWALRDENVFGIRSFNWTLSNIYIFNPIYGTKLTKTNRVRENNYTLDTTRYICNNINSDTNKIYISLDDHDTARVPKFIHSEFQFNKSLGKWMVVYRLWHISSRCQVYLPRHRHCYSGCTGISLLLTTSIARSRMWWQNKFCVENSQVEKCVESVCCHFAGQSVNICSILVMLISCL